MLADRLPAPSCSTSSCSPTSSGADRIGELWGYPESRVCLVRNRIEHEVSVESCFLH